MMVWVECGASSLIQATRIGTSKAVRLQRRGSLARSDNARLQTRIGIPPLFRDAKTELRGTLSIAAFLMQATQSLQHVEQLERIAPDSRERMTREVPFVYRNGGVRGSEAFVHARQLRLIADGQ
jgi:hypothetical protein